MRTSSTQDKENTCTRSKPKCKRKLFMIARYEKPAMAPEASNHCESNSFDAILDHTNPEKLVQIIREKRGLQSAKRIFPEANVEKRSSKQKSFPFEIQTKSLTPPAPNVESTNENSVNAANPKVIPIGRTRNKDQTDSKNESVNDKNESQLPFSKCKTSVRRSSHNLGRRVLLKAFEKIQKEDGFYPVASSTPLQRSAPYEEFESLSNINRDSGDEVSSSSPGKNIDEQGDAPQQIKNIRQENNKEESIITETDQQHKSKHHKCKSHRISETIKQPKTITESLLCQSHEVIQNNADNPRDHNGTQLYDDGIEVDETLIGPSAVENAVPRPDSNADVENKNNLTEGTLIGEDNFDAQDERPSSTAKSLEVRKEANQLAFNSNEIHQERTSINATRNKTSNESKTVPSSRQSQSGIPLNNCFTEHNEASSTRKSGGENFREQHFSANRVCSELIAIANKLPQSKDRESNILVPPSPFRSGYLPRKSQGASFSVPSTQSPQIQPIHVSCAKSPTFVIPIYPHTCHQNKATEPPTTRTAVSSENRGSGNAATNDASEILNTRNHKRVSDEKGSEKLLKQSRLSIKHSKFNRRSSIITRTEPEITSDEDNGREQIRHRQSIHVQHPEAASDKEEIAHQSRAVDLQSNMSRSRVYEKTKSQNVTLNSESSGRSFEEIIKIDEMLKKLNSSDNTSQQTLQPHEETVAKTHENVQMQKKNIQNEEYLGVINENIIEPVEREDAGCGYVYDLSPRLGKRYMESLLKSGKTRNTLNTKPRRRRRNTQNSPPLLHDDIALSIERQLKSRKSQKLSSNRQSRRKLYSKEIAYMDTISDDETKPCENTTHIHDATAASQQSVYDKKSKISKCRIPPKPVRFYTLQQHKEKWSQSDPAPPINKVPKRKKELTETISDYDELLFKVPEKPPPKRKTIQMHNRVGRNIKQVLALAQNKSRNDEDHDSSDSSSDESGCSKNLENNENEVSKQRNTVAASAESLFVQVAKSSASNEVERRRSSRTNGCFGPERLNPISNESLNIRKQCFVSSPLPVIEETLGTHVEQEQPVEPELKNHKITHTVNTSTKPLLRRQKNAQNCSHRDSNQSDSCKNKTVDKQNTSTKEFNRSYTAGPIFGKEAPASDVTLKKRGRKRKIAVSNPDSNQSSNKSSSSISTDTHVSDSTSVRRSARKHRPPQPYWTSRFIRLDEICYKEQNLKFGRKRRTRMESINEHPESSVAKPNEPQMSLTFEKEAPASDVTLKKRGRKRKIAAESPVTEPNVPQKSTDEQPSALRSNPKERKQLADDLFNAVKELSMNKQTIAEASKLQAAKTTRALRSKRKYNLREQTSDINSANEGTISNSEEHILTDSGHRTDSGLEAQEKSNNLLLSWLKNLVESKTISSNATFLAAFELSGAEIVPASTLVFRELEGVDYAYYTKSAQGHLYGYMRFHPGSAKRKAKTKDSELKIVNISGELTLYVGEKMGKLINGDFASVPKNTTYSIVNKSDEMALAFFSQVG